ncbi:MAG: hypothetical protein NTV63_03600 [Candidatus Woesearchaeota archaeon]|nr:hypothetical protein [Candidatus Woesearchaeota archaeon]
MKLAHQVEIRVFSKENEDYQRIISGLKSLFPFSLEENKIAVSETCAEGFDEKKIRIAEVVVSRESLVKMFLKSIISKLSDEQVEMLNRQIDSRVDDEENFFLRLDKERLLSANEYFITDSGNCYHIKITVAAFPKKREVAASIARQILKKESN